ncbi:MAG TPA: ATP synthase F0 subunit A [Deltaproteobacteria bacterium]|nr:MAG: ATP synthase F0 subunit A [Deltaproteobacteria bacterium GWA2_55_82]OGQ64637.1 MAG: ATP synthase F0 subunit A [Deltaproteobacteria bacterium RIFCSPLOWO2_02_FULL_55_12]OIJ73737.1 MAG: ATP synthase F0 subunit A [Deltaproteobacteria bacterium GWC2_55_46]HBG45867.1 ATP synthase F0 subunit A [Deltaproteobacteria bacterium]HCY09714.1 ATP synthase F0 subunit A [Deltaproteobacteria bacterium]
MHSTIIPTFGLPAHTAFMIYISIGLFVFSVVLAKGLRLVPGRTQSIVELTVSYFERLVDETMGHKGKKYFPFIMTLAVFIFVSNLMGLVPGLLPPTANLNTTAALAVIVFVLTHIVGVREHGIKYLKQFAGPIWWLMPIMIPVEIIGHIARPVSLSFRLFGNIFGHEQVVMVLLMLMPLAYPLLAFSTVLGVGVVFLQAFIFALLSMMYIGSALEEAHH